MTTKQQLRMLLDGYCYDRMTGSVISVPKSATQSRMVSIASRHALGVSVVGGEVRLQDDCHTYAVRNGEIAVIAG